MDAVLQLAQTLLASPWLYALVLGVTLLDAVIPVVPGETLVITAAAYAVTGDGPDAALVLLAAWAGALSGDLIAHQLGRGAGGLGAGVLGSGALSSWVRRRRRGGAVVAWARRELTVRGGMLLVSARFIPGGRTATTIASGLIGYPRPRFLGFAALAGLLWSLYGVGIGMLGGLALHEQPLMGVALGIGIALVVSASIETVRAVRRRRRAGVSRRPSAELAASPAPVRGA